MRTVGVDLAAEAPSTAIAVIDWDDAGTGRVTELALGAGDADVMSALARADRAAVDCPLGWPEPFIEFLLAHRSGHIEAPAGTAGLAWRRILSRRATDLACEQTTGVRPLSVAADRIAAVAMRGAGLLGALAAAGTPVDRAGNGMLVETYPAAALKTWGLPHQGYKGAANTAALGRLVDALVAASPGLDLGQAEVACRRSDDALDAVICSVVARAAALGQTLGPPEALRPRAATEGWIILPTEPLSALL